MRVAVLVDAAFFLSRYKRLVPQGKTHSGTQVAEALHSWACQHMRFDGSGEHAATPSELYRIFVYDCAPFNGKMTNAISGEVVDFGKSEMAVFRSAFHARLPQLRKVALRLGHLSDVRQWTIKPTVLRDLVSRKREATSLQADELMLDVKQKGVDMRIGVDVASLAYKKLVDRIVLVAGDADFVPAAKLARREGLDFVLDSMHAHINPSLYEHIDGLMSMAPSPVRAGNAQQQQPVKGYGARYTMPYQGAYGIPSPDSTRRASSAALETLRGLLSGPVPTVREDAVNKTDGST